MFDALELFRARVGGSPSLLTGLLLFVLIVLQRRCRGVPLTSWLRFSMRLIGVAGAVGLVTYAIVAAWYASDPHFFDNAEPSVVALGWLYHVGQPVYHSLDSAERYSHIYGPMLFILHGVALGLLGPSLGVSKWLSVGSSLLSLLCLFGAIRRHASPLRAFAITGVCALLLLLFGDSSFWTRPEPIQLVTVSAALFLSGLGGAASAALSGLACGVLWNLKFTGPLYSLPVAVLLYRRTGWTGTLLAAAVALSVAAWPFVALPNVSFAHYLSWLRLSGGTGLLLSTLRQNMEWAAYLSLPLLIAYFVGRNADPPQDPGWITATRALLLGMLGVVVAASKPGAGPYHLIPFLPTIAYLVAWRTAHLLPSAATDPVAPLAAIAFVVTAIAISGAQQVHFVNTMAPRRALADMQDIERFASTHPGIVGMGYGDTEALSHERPVLVFRNGSYLLDQPALREYQLQGLAIPAATIDAIAQCRAAYWLIPKGETPFNDRNSYAAVLAKPIFSEAFRKAFDDAYIQVDATTYYDVWRCRHQQAR